MPRCLVSRSRSGMKEGGDMDGEGSLQVGMRGIDTRRNGV